MCVLLIVFQGIQGIQNLSYAEATDLPQSAGLVVPNWKQQTAVQIDIVNGALEAKDSFRNKKGNALTFWLRLPKLWSYDRGLDPEQFADGIFLLRGRLFAIGRWPDDEVEFLRNSADANLQSRAEQRFVHEVKLRIGPDPGTALRLKILAALGAGLIAWNLPDSIHDFVHGMTAISENNVHLALSYLGQGVVRSLPVDLLGAGALTWNLYLSGIHKERGPTAARIDGTPLQLKELIRDSEGNIVDLIYQTDTQRSGRLTDYVLESSCESLLK